MFGGMGSLQRAPEDFPHFGLQRWRLVSVIKPTHPQQQCHLGDCVIVALLL